MPAVKRLLSALFALVLMSAEETRTPALSSALFSGEFSYRRFPALHAAAQRGILLPVPGETVTCPKEQA